MYASGFYVNSLFTRNLGIPPIELVRLEYISIGASFALITTLLGILPIGAFYLTYKVRRASGLPHLHIGAIGNSLNTIACLGFVLFLALFVTRYEWNMTLSHSVLGLRTFKAVALTYAVVSLTGMVVVPYLERLINCESSSRRTTFLFRSVVEPLRFG